MHRLRRLHDGMSSNAALRVRSGTGRAEGDLPAVPASRSQHLHHFAPRDLSLRGGMPHPSERAGLCNSDRARTLRGGAPGHSARQPDSVDLRPHLHPPLYHRLHAHRRRRCGECAGVEALHYRPLPQLQAAATVRARTSGEDCHRGVRPGRPPMCLRTPAEGL